MKRFTTVMGELVLASALGACSHGSAQGSPSDGPTTTASCSVEVHLVSWDVDYDSAQSEDDVIDPDNSDARHYRVEDCAYADDIQERLKHLKGLARTEGTTKDVRLVVIVRRGSSSEMLSVPRMCDWVALNRKRAFQFDQALLELLMRPIPEKEREVIRGFSSCSRSGT